MGIKFNDKTKTYTVSFTKRDPISRKPYGLKRIGILTKAEAHRVLTELTVKVHEHLKRKKIPLWQDFQEEYIQFLKTSDLAKSTSYNHECMLRHHCSAWNKIGIDEIKTSDITVLMRSRLGNNAEAHKKYFVKVIKASFQYAVDRGLLDKNPSPLIKFKIKDKNKAVLNEEKILELLRKAQACDWQWYPHYSVAVFTGLRNGELYALTWDKVDLERRQILVNYNWTSKNGFKDTKSGDDRIVEIPNPLLPLLRELKLNSAGSNYVLPRLSKWDKGEQARELRMFLQSIGIPPVRFHDLRASWVTMLLSRGVAPTKVMSMGGWKGLKTMMIYLRKAGIDIRDSTNVLDHIQSHGLKGGTVIEMASR